MGETEKEQKLKQEDTVQNISKQNGRTDQRNGTGGSGQ